MNDQRSEVRDYDRETARGAARKMMRFADASVDGMGHSEDDYQQLFLVAAWQARKKFQTSAGGDERKYCCKSVWNAHATLQRVRSRAMRDSVVVRGLPLEAVDTPSELDIEAVHHARESIELLRAELSPADWAVLERVGLSSEGAGCADAHEEGDGNYNAFYKRVEGLREKARVLLRDWED